MRDQRLVEDRVDRLAVVGAALGDAAELGAGSLDARSVLVQFSDLCRNSISRSRARSASEIALSVQAAIADGRLAPGAALPSVRRLATDLEVSPTTVAAALADLRRRGVVVSRPRSGTRVAERPPLRPARPAAAVPEGARDLATGSPDPALLPALAPALHAIEAPQRLYGARAARCPSWRRSPARRSRPTACPRRACARSTGRSTGSSACSPPTCSPATRSRSRIPGWPGVLDVARMLGLRLVPVAVDERGMLPDALAAAQRAGARAVVLTPRGHNPCGAALDAAPGARAARRPGRGRAGRRGRPPRPRRRHAVAHARGRPAPLGDRPLGVQVARPRPAAGARGRRRHHPRPRRGPPVARPRLGQRHRPAADGAAVVATRT